MADEAKLFTCVKSGLNIRINPRSAAGWRALGLWMAGFFAMLGLFLTGMATAERPQLQAGFTALFLLATAIWAVTMIRWMMARSEMINVKELLALKRQLDRNKRG
ncbi:hypothetical protein [Novosphingobium sp.]|uniref:hypothetical protein n=1 Tax=Novosphingobium sp. TaxID=1874826 RepID=UPI00286B0EB9|nr:hypothetical protein [Novosphingobium sp.]